MFLVSCAMMTLLVGLKAEGERRRERKMRAGGWVKSLHNHAFRRRLFSLLWFHFGLKQAKKKENLSKWWIRWLFCSCSATLLLSTLFWYLFISTFLWKFWIIWYLERQIWCTYRYSSDKCESFRWSLTGRWFMVLSVSYWFLCTGSQCEL